MIPHPVLPPAQGSIIEVVPIARSRRAANAGLRLPAQPLNRDELRAVLRTCSRRYSCPLRLRALIVVMWRTGIRCEEAVSLRLRDLDRDEGTIRVQRGKGGKPRTVAMDETGWTMLAEWTDRRRELGIGDGFVFCTLHGGKLDKSFVRRSVRRAAKRADVGVRVHPHGLRHTFTAELVREGVGIVLLQRMLGHASLAHTSRYAASVGATAELVAVAKGRPAPW